VRRRLTVAATSLAAAALALAPATGSAEAAQTPGRTPGTTPTGTPSGGGATPGTGTPSPGAESPPQVDRIVADPRITEASGLASSVRHAGVVWTHQDSGHPAQVFAVDTRGTTAAVVSLRGVQPTDWESMAITRDSGGRWMLAMGDIGDNNARRSEVEVLLVREPTVLRNVRLRVQRTLRLRYPDGAADAETLVADPRTQRLYVVTKGLLGGDVYAVPPQAWPGGSDASAQSRVWPLQRVAHVDMSLVTDGAFLPDGRLVLRNYGSMTVYQDPATADGTMVPQSTMVLPEEPQGESVALGPGGRSLLVGSEGERQPLMRLTLPAVVASVSGEPVETTSARDVAAARPASATEGGDTALPSFLLLVVGAGVVLLLLIFGAVMFALR
jgi:hypothetical protein